ncbi:MAG: tRNA (guanosine(37)-N1)-methyltransferase TrmD [Candidatus Omnitrophota bacterium]
MLQIDVLTIFPEMFLGVLKESIIKRAQEKKKVKINLHDLRNFTLDKHRKVDDKPFGGGPGMIMTAQPIFDGVAKVKKYKNVEIVLLCAQGKTLNHKLAVKLSKKKQLVLICPHYEGVDERVREALITAEISIGDYILTGGELPAMVLIDSVTRLLPGVLGNKESIKEESFSGNVLEYPHYTRPAEFRALKVPEVLLRGDHKKIEEWRAKESLKRTKKKRPDLLL